MRLSRSGYRLVEGEIASLAVAPHLIDFGVAGRRITVEKTAATSGLQRGEQVRMLLQEPFDDTHFHLVAFQKAAGERIHFTGPSLTTHVTFIGAALLAIGIYADMALLLVSATALFLLECLFSAQKAEALRLFRGR
jgi:hypothetical protein